MLSTIFIHLSVFVLVSTSISQKRQGASISSACKQTSTANDIHHTLGSYDITRSGRYTIVNCGNHDAARLVSLLDNLWTVLQPSIRDSSLLSPSPAYRTFFNYAYSAPYVRQLLSNVTSGVSLYPAEERFQQTGSPLFMCVTQAGQLVGQRGGIDYYLQCVLDPHDSLIPISGTPYIVVCPYLFSSGVPDSPPADTCLTVDNSIRRFQETGLDFTKFRVWILLEGILRYYIYATTASSAAFATDVNKCVRLGTKEMAENPSNYVYYVASKPCPLPHSFSLKALSEEATAEIFNVGVYGQCRDFPDFSVPRRRPLENATTPDLIRADDGAPNSTDAVDIAVSSQDVVVDLSGSMDT